AIAPRLSKVESAAPKMSRSRRTANSLMLYVPPDSDLDAGLSMRQPEQPLKVLIVGSGGREHVLASLCRKSPDCREVIAGPGNGGMAAEIPCHPVAADDDDGLVDLAVREKVDFVVVGREAPLSLGLVDALATRNIAAYGPEQAGAR